jgi:hypothetical protein
LNLLKVVLDPLRHLLNILQGMRKFFSPIRIIFKLLEETLVLKGLLSVLLEELLDQLIVIQTAVGVVAFYLADGEHFNHFEVFLLGFSYLGEEV